MSEPTNEHLISLLESAIQKVKLDELSKEQSQQLWDILTQIPLSETDTIDQEQSDSDDHKQLLRYLFTGWWISNWAQ